VQDPAWASAQLLLFAPEAPLEAKLFGAQTFRTKVRCDMTTQIHTNKPSTSALTRNSRPLQITYDLDRLPEGQLIPLRDSLLAALRSFASGPKVVLTQLCIALADLALQIPNALWANPTASMISQFGSDPAMAGALLEFLQVLAEEFTNNLKITVKSDFGRGPDVDAQGQPIRRGEQLVNLVSMYVQAQGKQPSPSHPHLRSATQTRPSAFLAVSVEVGG